MCYNEEILLELCFASRCCRPLGPAHRSTFATPSLTGLTPRTARRKRRRQHGNRGLSSLPWPGQSLRNADREVCPLHHSPPTLRRVLFVLLHVCHTRFARAQMAPRVCAMLAALRQTQAEVGNDASPGAVAWAQPCIKNVKLDVLPSAGVQCLAASLKRGEDSHGLCVGVCP